MAKPSYFGSFCVTQCLAVQKKRPPLSPNNLLFGFDSFVSFSARFWRKTSAGSATFALIQQRPTSGLARCRNLSLGGTLGGTKCDESLGDSHGVAGGRP